MNRIISLFLFIFIASCLNGQYNSPIRNKVTLGKQTTADGLVWRGRTSDTANLMTNKLDTSVYLVLDTMTEAMWLYRVTTTPKWNRVVDSLNNMQGQLSLTTKVTGTLPVANGGTNASTFTAGSVVFAGTGGTYTQKNNSLFFNSSNNSFGVGKIPSLATLDVAGSGQFTSTLSGTDANFSGSFNANSYNIAGISNSITWTTNTLRIGQGEYWKSVELWDSVNIVLKTIQGGNVGIGTASPTARLHVKGSANASEFALKVDDSGSNNLLSVQNNGNVGIGTASPNAKLEVRGRTNIFGGGSTSATLGLTILDSPGNFYNFYLEDDGGAYLRGNVRIGNSTNNGYKLDVDGTGRFTGALTGTSATFSSSVTANSLSLTTPLSVANGGTNITTFTAANRIPYASSATALTTTNKFTFDPTGNKLIISKNDSLDSNPNFTINLSGSDAPSPLLGFRLYNTTLQKVSLFRYDNNHSFIFLNNDSDNGLGSHRFKIGSGNGEEILTITRPTASGTDGRVGIGTTSPTEKLHVVGNGLFTDTMRIEDAIKVGANNAYVYSAGTGNYYFTKDYKNQSGTYVIAIGDGVLKNATTVSNPASSRFGSIAIGYNNLQNMVQTASSNNAVWNTSIGYNNMSSVTTGGFNTSVGAQSLKLLTTGISNVAIGTTTLENMTTGGSNLGLGDGALRFVSTGDNNVGIGSNAGSFRASDGEQVTSINNSIFIGQRADPSGITGVTNEIAIGYLAKGQGSNSIMLGNSSVTNAYCYDNTFSTPSDFRDKTNIENLNTGLDLILNLRPVKFQWNMRDYGKVGYKDIGFIAQEALYVQNINNEADNIKLVNDENQNQLSMQSGNLIPILVKAMQEQQAQIEALKQRLLILENK